MSVRRPSLSVSTLFALPGHFPWGSHEFFLAAIHMSTSTAPQPPPSTLHDLLVILGDHSDRLGDRGGAQVMPCRVPRFGRHVRAVRRQGRHDQSLPTRCSTRKDHFADLEAGE